MDIRLALMIYLFNKAIMIPTSTSRLKRSTRNRKQKRLVQGSAQNGKLESRPEPFTEKVQSGERDDHESPENHKMRASHDKLIKKPSLAEDEFEKPSYPGADIVPSLFGFKQFQKPGIEKYLVDENHQADGQNY
jgi:hypothetical protein